MILNCNRRQHSLRPPVRTRRVFKSGRLCRELRRDRCDSLLGCLKYYPSETVHFLIAKPRTVWNRQTGRKANLWNFLFPSKTKGLALLGAIKGLCWLHSVIYRLEPSCAFCSFWVKDVQWIMPFKYQFLRILRQDVVFRRLGRSWNLWMSRKDPERILPGKQVRVRAFCWL